ncbi:MAG TPA: DEAD/DEAH box helicase family protein, partial [Steroidobacteraceae bacterium]
MPQIFRVALDTPLRRLFDYLPPSLGAVQPAVGARVRVPFGRQRLVGVITGLADHSDVPAARLRPILEVLDGTPVLDGGLQELLRWAAEYYHHPLGEVLAGALPRALRLGASSVAREERWLLTEAGTGGATAGKPRRAPKQRALVEFLREHGAADATTLDARFGAWRDAARALTARGWIASAEVELERARPALTTVRSEGPELLPEQSSAVAAITASLDRFGAFVLHGITGSGKTEVYLRVIEQVLLAGRRALVLVPE